MCKEQVLEKMELLRERATVKEGIYKAGKEKEVNKSRRPHQLQEGDIQGYIQGCIQGYTHHWNENKEVIPEVLGTDRVGQRL